MESEAPSAAPPVTRPHIARVWKWLVILIFLIMAAGLLLFAVLANVGIWGSSASTNGTETLTDVILPNTGKSYDVMTMCEVQYSGLLSPAENPIHASDFPKGFIFGMATAAFQIEGAQATEYGRGLSIWDIFVQKPGNIVDGSTAAIADDSYHKYKEDVALLKSLGFTSYRFSISWPRLLPQGTGAVNQQGLQYYNDLIDALVEAEIEPLVTLYHWDLPDALHRSMGGWLNASIVEYFKEYCDLCFRTYGDRVRKWVTFNEPQNVAVQGYASGTQAPKRCSNRTLCAAGNSSTEAYIVGHNVLKAHAAVVALYRSQYKTDGGKIGLVLASQYFYPLTQTDRDIGAAQRSLLFNIGWFANPVIRGDYPDIMKKYAGSRLPAFTEAEKTALQGSIDFLGLNPYTSTFVFDAGPPPPGMGYPWTDTWANTTMFGLDGSLIGAATASTWLNVVPTTLFSVPLWVHTQYPDTPIWITESGVSDSGNASLPLDVDLCDYNRVLYYRDYLGQLLRAMREGAKVEAYYGWSLIDNFEWAAGYSERFGIHYVNFTDPERPRIPKLSARWWQSFLETS